MDEKKIHVIINKIDVELESNNPDLKNLVNVIISQDENFDFNNIEIKVEDDNFDRIGKGFRPCASAHKFL